MQIIIKFRALQKGIALPVHYNDLVQGWIYQHLESNLSRRVHSEGWQDGKRKLRFFVFSRLIGDVKVTGDRIQFLNDAYLAIASPLEEILENLTLSLFHEGMMNLKGVYFEVISVEVIRYPNFKRPVLLKALSPITVYSTLATPDGRKKTYYYAPQEPEFGQQVLANLRRKIRAWTGEDIPPDGASFRPVKVSNRNLVVARYKGTIIKGWTGIYELDAPEPYLRMALDAGLGAKNSQGFGFVEVWEGKKNHTKTQGAQKKTKNHTGTQGTQRE